MGEAGPAAVVVLAAGSGSRVGAGVNKVLLPLDGRPVVAWPVQTALAVSGVGVVLVVVRPGEAGDIAAALEAAGVSDPRLRLVEGGATRHESEWQALLALAPELDSGAVDVVAIHDAARPRASRALFEEIIAVARARGGAIPALELTDVVHREPRADRAGIGQRLVGVQTPQAFRAGPLLAAYRRADAEGFTGTDTASCLERYAPQVPVVAVAGEPANVKITFAGDLGPTATSAVGLDQHDGGAPAP